MHRTLLIVFIAFAEFNLALASFSKDCPVKCEIIYDPLCGSNGRTYKNKCQLKRDNCFAKTKVLEIHKGECFKSGDDGEEIEERQPYNCLRVGRRKYLTC
ncbi:Serine protease inhibitor Kazal-type 5 [Desmophyllum pertusum]|uniref:Serine protease inhibitor Kazal-type 5 n=1 Tax=Desmophyllum pertusum TaxID=174260 RepID=A0A9W9YZD3_9CNID|nr:Serine protease inhibitor Kazal-type 5 [Desmophyllum pertusum]